MAFKIDMNKAYDCVEGDFLKALLLKMGFSFEWVNMIMHCATIVRYSVFVSGEPMDYFKLPTV